MSLIANIPPPWWTGLSWLLMAAVGTLLLVHTRLDWRGTTLAAPVYWLIAAILGLGLTHAMVPLWAPDWSDESLQYAAATLLFAPPLAVLGAKRPQDRGWQWVVFCLLITLWIPIIQGKLQSAGDHFSVFVAWTLFHATLILVGLLAYLPTRHALASLCYAAGHASLLAPTFASPNGWTTWYAPFGLALLAAAGMLVLVRPRPPTAKSAWERLWVRFRDAFGAFWALRVMQRVNEGSTHGQWGFQLAWDGLVDPQSGMPMTVTPDQQAKLEQALRTQLRRFVSADWITRELAREPSEPSADR